MKVFLNYLVTNNQSKSKQLNNFEPESINLRKLSQNTEKKLKTGKIFGWKKQISAYISEFINFNVSLIDNKKHYDSLLSFQIKPKELSLKKGTGKISE